LTTVVKDSGFGDGTPTHSGVADRLSQAVRKSAVRFSEEAFELKSSECPGSHSVGFGTAYASVKRHLGGSINRLGTTTANYVLPPVFKPGFAPDLEPQRWWFTAAKPFTNRLYKPAVNRMI
jgi:hypothetical protein